jgi:hypothetical protein
MRCVNGVIWIQVQNEERYCKACATAAFNAQAAVNQAIRRLAVSKKFEEMLDCGILLSRRWDDFWVGDFRLPRGDARCSCRRQRRQKDQGSLRKKSLPL